MIGNINRESSRQRRLRNTKDKTTKRIMRGVGVERRARKRERDHEEQRIQY